MLKKIPPEKGIRRDFLCDIEENGGGVGGTPPYAWPGRGRQGGRQRADMESAPTV